jgi:acyl carrier protein
MTVNMDTTRERIKAIIAKKLKKSMTDISDDSTLQEIGIDSLDLVEIIMDIEEQFNITIDDAEAERLKTVGEVILYIDFLSQKQQQR